MRKILITILVFGMVACAKVPITGRRQMNLLPESNLMQLSLTNYQQFLSTNKVVESGNSEAAMVRRVGDKIAKAVEEYLHSNGGSKRIKGYTWEFNLVQDNAVNAWCMPGGKVVVYTGLLPVAKDEEGLAVVMGHEIAHAIARHGNERMSQQLLVQAGGLGLTVAMDDQPKLTKDLFMMSYGLSTQMGVLKYSRSHESEADKMGLVFMAMAGYNPTAAISFWERMASNSGGSPPELLSTHPSHDTRIKEIDDYLPMALTYYKK